MAMAKGLVVIVLISAFFSLTLCQERIFNGHEAEEKEFPYMVNMRQMNYLRCGGALISNQHVLTAAHCLMDIGEDWHIRLALGGRHFNDIEPEPNEKDPNVVFFREPMKFWIHEDFSMPSAENDIAIIELPRPVEFTEHIKPIEISADKEIDGGTEVVATIMGYGKKEDGSIESETLQKAQVKLIPISDCFQYQPNFVETITTNHICAFGENSTEDHVVSPCDGDSGSPIVHTENGRLIGITSFVTDAEDGKPLPRNKCNTSKAPAVYVRVASYLDWISSKTGISFE